MGTTATKHPMTIQLPHCWVCGTRFVSADPPGTADKEEHHVIPRQAGGSDGPTVSLCGKHHAALHRIAERLETKKPYFVFLQGEPQEAQRKIMWLATKAYNAFAATKDDPNKHAMVLISLDARQQQMIDSLKRVFPKARSREAIYNLALERLYSAHFNPEVE